MRVEDVPFPLVAPPAGDGDEATSPAEGMDEKQQILDALQATNWRVYGARGAAHLLGMPRRGGVPACVCTGCNDPSTPLNGKKPRPSQAEAIDEKSYKSRIKSYKVV